VGGSGGFYWLKVGENKSSLNTVDAAMYGFIPYYFIKVKNKLNKLT